ncbi:aldehyde dehydrogenase 3H1 [Dactylonectria macrodidyma]|uniref:Aldehyde dehydrogenase n=1 Tax=Dactylonectria macrodidyma TaxID=307937 RepID=A0A9P9FWW3_9HYPO|nr:aldehyde dehydrogenase 3H1 [Dactylonectria macrodidyma]
MSSINTPQREIDDAYATLFSTFASGRTKDLAWRRWQLKQLWWMIEDNEDQIVEALHKDLNRHIFESTATDVYGIKTDILDFLKHMDEWTSTTKIDAGIIFKHFGGARLRKDPLGVALIIGAWNFPFVLMLQPVIAAVASGCCVMMKPSELAVHSERLLYELVPKYLDPLAIRVACGGPSETTYILEKRFNHIFFTGSSKIARFVAAAAAKHLTPTVLELGGQGPCIVTKTADIELAARRITNAKFTNAGQICLSVNHVFAEPEIVDQLIERLSYWNDQYLSNGSDQMCRIINGRNFDRLVGFLEKTNGQIVYGGKWKRSDRFIHPTIVKGVALDDALMSEELFGPILPIITSTLEDAINTIQGMPEPLAIYLFSKDKAVHEEVLDRTLSGGVTINSVLFHASLHGAPFGGVGESGYGAYHGKHGIDCFTHARAVVAPPSWFDLLTNFMYAPYTPKSLKYVRVRNTLGFKRGETLEDQRRSARVTFVAAFTVWARYSGVELATFTNNLPIKATGQLNS